MYFYPQTLKPDYGPVTKGQPTNSLIKWQWHYHQADAVS